MIDIAKQTICGLSAFGLGLAAVLLLGACGTSAIEAQREAAQVVSRVGNSGILPALELAEKTEALRIVATSDTREEAIRRYAESKAQWVKVWAAWNAFVTADSAWLVALDSGEALPAKAAAVRAAFCSMRSAALELGAHIETFPVGGCP